MPTEKFMKKSMEQEYWDHVTKEWKSKWNMHESPNASKLKNIIVGKRKT